MIDILVHALRGAKIVIGRELHGNYSEPDDVSVWPGHAPHRCAKTLMLSPI